MNVNILISDEFRRNAKKLIKKYRSLKSELSHLIEELQENPRKGVKIGENIYKLRLAVKSKGRGKSGGMRIITYVDFIIKKKEEKTTVILLTIYDKSEFNNVTDQYIKRIIEATDLYEEE